MRLIDGDALYEKACDLEAQALDYTVKISHDDEKVEEWRRWSAILAERSAFKHDVYDAPTIEPERKAGEWVEIGLINHTYKCSVCGRLLVDITDGKNNVAKNYPYCHCGAYMGGNEDETD